MYAKWTRCPHCRKTLNFETGGGGTWEPKLGRPTVYSCPHCHGQVSGGKVEWDKMGVFAKADKATVVL